MSVEQEPYPVVGRRKCVPCKELARNFMILPFYLAKRKGFVKKTAEFLREQNGITTCPSNSTTWEICLKELKTSMQAVLSAWAP